MSGYAAGPWTAVGFELDPAWDGYTFDIMRIGDGGGVLLFECDCRDLEPDEARATMSLVEAAPDLLEACEAALPYIMESGGRHTLGLLIEAIRKARGKE
jgi:hypothetical protein